MVAILCISKCLNPNLLSEWYYSASFIESQELFFNYFNIIFPLVSKQLKLNTFFFESSSSVSPDATEGMLFAIVGTCNDQQIVGYKEEANAVFAAIR